MPNNKRVWTRADYEFLRDNYAHVSVKQMALFLIVLPAQLGRVCQCGACCLNIVAYRVRVRVIEWLFVVLLALIYLI